MLKKAVLASLKSDIDKLHFNNLKTVPTDLNTLSNVVDNNVVKKKKDVDKMIPNTSKFIVTKDFNRLTKINFKSRKKGGSKNVATKKTSRECT